MSQGVARSSFVHLHLHSEYSLLDGGNRVDKLVRRVKELGMHAVAVTDHGNLHAAVSFWETARRAGIKPILGVEAYVASGDRRDRTYTGVADGGHHLVLLAENARGWENLLYLCSEAYLTGFYFKPRMDREILERHAEGLIAINGHLGSELAFHLVRFEQGGEKAHWDAAVRVALWHAETFKGTENGPGFFVELQHHIELQNSINPHLIRLARQLGLPLVCDNDSHFLLETDQDAHDTLICISTGKVKNDPDRMRYPTEVFVKGPGEMEAIFHSDAYNNEGFGDAGREAMANTVAIADRCCVDLPLGGGYAPVVLVRPPEAGSLPGHDDPRFAGDLTAWFTAFCSAFPLEPATDPGLKQEELRKDCDAALRMLSEAGMVWRYGPGILEHRHGEVEGEGGGEEGQDARPTEEWKKWARLNRELAILADKGISAYFLIVWDFVNWGRQRGIPSIARGSGVGTMVGYVLGLSNACPVHYGLLFERFTDPDRSEYPDIDIDLCQEGRGAVINYVREKYGHVAQIITFGTLKARAAIRDVARVLEMPLSEADRLAKMVPEELNITLDKALEQVAELRAWYERDGTVRRVIDTARTFEGQARHASVHAAGVIVATRPLHEVVPLYRAPQAADNEVVTQWDGPTCEKMGLLKMDFLGLRTLTVIERCKTLIRETLPEEEVYRAVGRDLRAEGAGADTGADTGSDTGSGAGSVVAHPLDLERLGCDDPRVFDLFQRGDTTGVFQFESGGMRRLLTEMRPDRLEDLIAANALFRPGPMDLIPDYNRRKHGHDAVPQVHPIVDRFTAETYGVMVYQEQVMRIVHELGGVPLRSAYSLIKAISKKKEKIIEAERPKFVEGAARQGLPAGQARDLFELILKFAGYGFNKSHSTGYAIVAYQTAYLKTFFPAHYMAAFLTFESQAQKVSDWIPYLEDCKRTRSIDPKTGAVVRRGVEVMPPDVNLSRADFFVVYDRDEPRRADRGQVRFGLRAIKGAGAKAIEAIVGERDGETKRRRDGGGVGRSDEAIQRQCDEGKMGEPRSDATSSPLLSDPSVASSLRRSVASPGSVASPFTSMFDFCERVPAGVVNKATVEALVKAGAFDSLHARSGRAAMVATIEQAVAAGQKIASDKAAGQGALFGGGGFTDAEPASNTRQATPLAKVEPWSEAETLRQEKETLGFYVSNHPLDEWGNWARAFTPLTLSGLKGLAQDKRVIVPAMVQSARTIVVKNGRSAGQKMAILTIEDSSGAAEAVLFANVYQQFGHLFESDQPKFFMGRLDHSRGDPQLVVDRVVPIDGHPLEQGTIQVLIRAARLNGTASSKAARVRDLLAEPPDPTDMSMGRNPRPIEIIIETDDAWVWVEPKGLKQAQLGPELVRRLCDELGKDSVRLAGGVSVELNKDDRRRQYAKG